MACFTDKTISCYASLCILLQMPPMNILILPLTKSQLCPTAQEATLMSIKRAYACITISCKNSLEPSAGRFKSDWWDSSNDFSKKVSLKYVFPLLKQESITLPKLPILKRCIHDTKRASRICLVCLHHIEHFLFLTLTYKWSS